MPIRPLWCLLWLGLLASSAPAQDGAGLIRDLQAEPTAVRRAAALRLREADRLTQRQALPTLIDRLQNEKDGQVRLAVLDTVTALGPDAESAIPALGQTLRTNIGSRGAEESHQDYRSALALAAIGPPSLPELRALLTLPKESVRAEVIMALGRLGSAAAPAVPDLVPLLSGASDRIGRELVTALGRIGPPAVEPLLAASRSADRTVRSRAIASLGQVQPPDDRIEVAVLAAATDPDPGVRTEALAVLGRFPIADLAVLPVLRAGLRDPAESPRRAVATMLHDRRDWIAQLAPDLEALLLDPDAGIAVPAGYLLGRLGREASPRLITALAHPASPTRTIGTVLARIGSTVVPDLEQAIQSPDPRVRRGAALALGQVRPVPVAALARLLPGLDDADPAVRGDFLAAIGYLGGRGKDAVPQVRALLHDPDAANRRQAIAILAQSAPRDDRLMADLRDAVEDPTPTVQQAAIATLQTLGPLGRPALAQVIGVTTSPDRAVRLAAVEFIESHGGAAVEAVPLVANLLADPDPQIRFTAAQTLGKLGKPAQVAYGRLVPLFGDDQASVREVAALAVGNLELDADTLRPDLVRVLKDEKLDVRKAAIRSVGRLGPGGAIFLPDLIRLAGSKENARLIERPLRTFEGTGPDPRSVPELVALLDEDSVPVRLLAIRFLGLAGPTAQAVLPALDRLRADPSAEVRQQVKTACAQIRPDPEKPGPPGEHP